MFEFKLPDVGEGVAEGEVVAWHVEVGDEVEEDQVVAEVETDKAVVDVPIPVAGIVQERHAEVGEILPVGETLISIDTGEAGDADSAAAADSADGDSGTAGAGGEAAGTGEAAAGGAEAADGSAPGEDGQEPVTDAPAGRVFAPPHVRRVARELGVDIEAVEGSGPGGRISEQDVRAHAAEGGSEDEDVAAAMVGADEAEADAVAAAEAGSGGAGPGVAPDQPGGAGEAAGTTPGSGAAIQPAERERTLAVPATRALADDLGVDIDAVPTDRTREGEPFVTEEEVRQFADAGTAAEAAAGAAGSGEAASGAGPDTGRPTQAGGVTTEAYRGVRRTIGKKMAESKYTAPHVSHHDSVDVSALVEARAGLKERAAERGVKLTYMPFVLKALVAGLRDFPILNSELDEEAEEIRIKHDYNIGVATATEAGLMVPVVTDVDEKGILELASEVNELTQKARERSISPAEMQGGTFSITNFGAIGGEYATPIINYPETAILGLGAIDERPWVVDGDVVARPVLPLSLSIDHRVIDGAEAAQFTNTVMEYLANPSMLLLE